MKLLLAAGTALLLAGCAAGPENRDAVLLASLNGIQEVPGPGDPDGNGTAEVRVNPRSGEICWDLYARSIGTATDRRTCRSPTMTPAFWLGDHGMEFPPVCFAISPQVKCWQPICRSMHSQTAGS